MKKFLLHHSLFTKQAIVFTCLLFLSVNLRAQTYQIGHTTLTFVDTTRNNRSIPTEIYYPSDTGGNGAPVANPPNGKFPVLSFGHGFVMTWDAYENIWNAVVPHGFVIVLPKTEGGFAPSHSDLALDLAHVLKAMKWLAQTNSPFQNKIDSLNCVMGHSMGGGAAFLAAGFDSSISSIATFAPAETSTSAIQAAANLKIPALVFAGSHDCVTPPANHQLPMYQALKSECKTYVSITGGSHCQMASPNLLCSIGEATCTPAPAITRAEQHQIIDRYLVPWLKYNLKGDCTAGASFDSLLQADASIAFQKNCILCNVNPTTDEEKADRFAVFPNPFGDLLHVQTAFDQPAEFILYDVDSKIILQRSFWQTLSLDTHNLAAGVYFFEIKNKSGTVSKGKLLRQ